MQQEQFDAVRNQLMSDDNDHLRQSIYGAFLEEPERGANMIINFAREKELKLDASTEDVVQAINTMDSEDIDIELTPEMLANVSGGASVGPNGKPTDSIGHGQIFWWLIPLGANVVQKTGGPTISLRNNNLVLKRYR